MKKIKNLMTMLVAISLIASLTACGTKNDKVISESSAATVESSEVADTTTVDTTVANDEVIVENDAVISENDEAIEEPPHEHTYVETITKEATCTEEGTKTIACECGESTEETIAAAGHLWGEYITNNDATYTADGTKTSVCATCGETDTVADEGSKLTYTYTDFAATKYAKQNVNVRDLPSTDGNKLGGLSAGQEVTVTGTCNETGWMRIEYNGSTAYVSNSYIVDTKPEPPKVEEPTQSTPAETTNSTTANDSGCPYPLYQPVDNGNSISWYYINGAANHPYGYDEASATLRARYGEVSLNISTEWTCFFYQGGEVARHTLSVP